MSAFSESIVEDAVLGRRDALDHADLPGPDIAVGELGAGRSNPTYRDVALPKGRLPAPEGIA